MLTAIRKVLGGLRIGAMSMLLALALHGSGRAQTADALPSWNDGPAKARIVAFVRAVSNEKDKDYVPPAERIAVFDNDGTLWGEHPMYYQLAFALDRVKQLAPKHPEWNQREPFRSALAGDLEGVAATGEKGLVELIAASHAGITTEEFEAIVRDWLSSARHPTLGRAYTAMVYQPMLELLAYLRANGFKTFIVSGGGVEFLRVFAEKVYGVPPEQVVGSSIKVKYESDAEKPKMQRLPEIDFIDDKAGKPVGIHYHIGRRPIAAFGNSDGDFEMLEWTTTGSGARLGVIVRHDDAEREFAYDRDSHIGRLARALDAAPKRGWTVVSMKADWARIHPPLR
jgi:phosphoglycolate phosphatase-like HAD superfamily hydrolase